MKIYLLAIFRRLTVSLDVESKFEIYSCEERGGLNTCSLIIALPRDQMSPNSLSLPMMITWVYVPSCFFTEISTEVFIVGMRKLQRK